MKARGNAALTRRLAQLALLAVVLLCTGGQLSLACHMILVAHESCREHGAIEHARPHAEHADGERSADPAVDRDHDGDHEVCSVLGVEPTLPAAALGGGAETVLVTAPCAPLGVGCVADESERWRLAPKNSPPL
jgi:hypothetical protein